MNTSASQTSSPITVISAGAAVQIITESALVTFTTDSFPIKLNPSNYFIWKAQFSCLMAGYNLLGFLDGTRPCPVATASSDGTIDQEIDFWTRQDHLVQHALLISVTESVALSIVFSETSHQAWRTLANLYANKSREVFRPKGLFDPEHFPNFSPPVSNLGAFSSPNSSPSRGSYNSNGNSSPVSNMNCGTSGLQPRAIHQRLALNQQQYFYSSRQYSQESYPHQNTFNRRRNNGQSNIVCQLCDQFGHSARNCPQIFSFAASSVGSTVSDEWELDS